MAGIVKAVVLPVKQQLLLPVGENAQIGVHQVQAVGEVVAPAALAKAGLNALIAKADEARNQLLQIAADGKAPGRKRPAEGAGGEGPGHQAPQRFLRRVHLRTHQAQGLIHALPGQDEADRADLQRVVAVHLNEGQEGMDVGVPHLRPEKHIVPAVLADIAEVAVALGVVFARGGEKVIVALRIAVLSAVQVHGLAPLALAQDLRVAAAQQVVQVALLDVQVKGRLPAPALNVLQHLLQHLGRALLTFFKIARGSEGGQERSKQALPRGMPGQAGKAQIPARGQGRFQRGKGAGVLVGHDLVIQWQG